jgi:hypothetical protein
MSRIDPIRQARALVSLPSRHRADDDPSPPAREERAQTPPGLIRPSTLLRPALGDAAAAATFEIHLLTGGGPRGLKADLGVRRQWIDRYKAAAEAAAEPEPRECGEH